MKKKRNKKVPAYAFGIDQMAGIGQLLGMGMQAIGNNGYTEPGMEAVPTDGQIAGNTLQGAASGAVAGLTVGGPIGAVAGGIVGAAGNLFGANKKRKAIRRRNERRSTLKSTEAGLNLQAGLADEYYDDNTLAYTFANGGIMPQDIAFVDNSEILRDTSGNLAQVPNTTNGTDEHLINTSTLESALSPNLKRKGSKETFAKAGEKIMKRYKPSKGNDRFAEATNELNKLHANTEYNQLLVEQETTKAKRGVKPQTKGIPAYKDGIAEWLKKAGNVVLNEISAPGRHILNAGNQFLKDFGAAGRSVDANTGVSENTQPGFLGYDRLQAGGSATQGYLGSPTTGNWGSVARFDTTGADGITGAAILNPRKQAVAADPAKQATIVIPPLTGATPAVSASGAKRSTVAPVAAPAAKVNYSTPMAKTYGTPAVTIPGLPEFGTPVATPIDDDVKDPLTIPNGFGNVGDLLSLTPTIYNWLQGMKTPEQETPQINPYSGYMTNAMASRRMNINPMLNANRNSRAIANYNAANLNANTGANLALRAQMASDEYANNANIYATKQNTDNQYLGDYANLLNNLGQQYTTSKQYTNDINAANRAAARNYKGTAASQLGQWAQVQQQMNNQQASDDMVYPLLETFLSQGYTQDQIDAIRNKYVNNRRGRKYGR